jgi:hypothetical protein
MPVDNRCVTSRNVVQAHERASRRLIELAEERLPITGPANEADIRVYGAGLVARIVGTVQAMLALAPSGRDADLNILVRAAFEHAVTFAWLAADPNRRFVRWQKEDAISRLAIHRDMQRFGETLLAPATEAELQRYAAASTKNPPNIPDRAAQADQYWGPRLQLPDPPDLASFRGLYTTVYRRGSSRTHATVLGLNDVVRRAGGGQYVVALEASGPQPSLRMAPFVLGLTLFVASDLFGRPERQAIDAVFDELGSETLS